MTVVLLPLLPGQRHAAPAEIKAGEEPESNHPTPGVVVESVECGVRQSRERGRSGEKAPSREPLSIPGFPHPSVGSGSKGMARRTRHRVPGLQDPDGLPGLVIISVSSRVCDLVRAPATRTGTHLLLFRT